MLINQCHINFLFLVIIFCESVQIQACKGIKLRGFCLKARQILIFEERPVHRCASKANALNAIVNQTRENTKKHENH
ncbi:hypothetical protein NC99_26700 [Sunxiuqinia dokdonensis]|uniref:Uncharacterized protein n=1 Tax=Sunxiuqinia dokdonensis TaxID=1409788 RepID=A0A0L8V7H7_9BACT|nr:hypothetical protein NC99_26700 [Sunxiuqinia dokdonensis]